jgi:RimJ/RimL family protein N-acetyltransferase
MMGDAGSGPELVTERLLMRRWLDADREPFAAMNADPEVMRFFPSMLDRPGSDALVDRFEAVFEERGYGPWALELRETGEFIGFTGLLPMPAGVPGEGGMEIGWRLARAAWKRGYATEAAAAGVDFAFEVAGLTEIWSHTAVVNSPSIAVMRRIGLSHVATADNPRVPDGPLRPHVFFHRSAQVGPASAASR